MLPIFGTVRIVDLSKIIAVINIIRAIILPVSIIIIIMAVNHKKKIYICDKEGCCSNWHSNHEQ